MRLFSFIPAIVRERFPIRKGQKPYTVRVDVCIDGEPVRKVSIDINAFDKAKAISGVNERISLKVGKAYLNRKKIAEYKLLAQKANNS